MTHKQLSVEVGSGIGWLAEVLETVAHVDANIEGISAPNESSSGSVLRFLIEDERPGSEGKPDEVLGQLLESHPKSWLKDARVYNLQDRPGALAAVVRYLASHRYLIEGIVTVGGTMSPQVSIATSPAVTEEDFKAALSSGEVSFASPAPS